MCNEMQLELGKKEKIEVHSFVQSLAHSIQCMMKSSSISSEKLYCKVSSCRQGKEIKGMGKWIELKEL